MVTYRWKPGRQRSIPAQYIGEVNESSEEMARCAALSRFGVGADEIDVGEALPRCVAIYPDDNFEVSPTT